MTDPLEDQLRRAMDTTAAGFSPGAPLAVTRSGLAGQVRRRQRLVLSLGVATVLLLSAGGVAVARVGSGGSSSHQVAAGGASRTGGADVSNGAPSGGGAGPPGAAGTGATGTSGAPAATITAPPGTAGPPSSAATGSVPATTAVPTSSTRATSPPAPSTTAPSSARVSQVQGAALFGPVCPVERNPPDPACAPRPGPAHIQLVRADGTVAAQQDAGSDGRFDLTVAPGSYTVTAASLPPAPAIGRACTATPDMVSLAPGAIAQVDVSCDTGIR